MNVSVDVSVAKQDTGWVATVRVVQDGRRTEHRVTVGSDDLVRYGASDVTDLVRRSFVFLLARESNTSILRDFRIIEIERYFPEYRGAIRRV
ncbi:MAG TPA: hypothetical protein VGR46_09435 [Candidatus Limnocylindria bacterium]|nr:hypothetical protein [Candidatus Limnocylindria bacterium]